MLNSGADTILHWILYFVAVTDLFSLANQCSRQAIRSHTDQSGAECIDSIYLSRTFSSSPFWKSSEVREYSASSEERPLSRLLLRTFHMEDLHWKYAATFYQLHKRTSLAACHTSYLLQRTPSTPSKTNILSGNTKKNFFSLWLKFTSAIRMNILSHWVPHSFDLVPHRSKELRKLL